MEILQASMETVMMDKKNKNYRKYKKQTQLVRGGLIRSQHGETSEAIFMNSGYVFNSAEEAKAKFAGELDGYLYSRYGNPTVTMFEERMALNEEAEACFATASGMAAVFASLMSFLTASLSCLLVILIFGTPYGKWMLVKINNAINVADKVKGTVIIDGRVVHSILYELLSDKGSGTLIRA